MRHLSLEELARLVDEAPDEREQAHLDACALCSEELAGLREQTLALSALEPPAVPAAVTDRVLASMPKALGTGGESRWFLTPAVGRIAAAIVLFAGGAAVGTWGIAPALGRTATADIAETAPAIASASVEDAAAALAAAEQEYLRALSNFAEASGEDDGFDPVSRLAALEGIVLTTRAALRQAPADPVINNYHLTAVGQRDALLRRIERLSTPDEWF